MLNNQSLSLYFPENSVKYLLEIQDKEKFRFELYQRKSGKYGYYRRVLLKRPILAVNVYYGKQVALFTFLHELAHHIIHKQYGTNRRIKPHGKEWKSAFRGLSLPFLTEDYFEPQALENLKSFFQNPKARINIESLFEMKKDHESYLKDIKPNETFLFRNKTYLKLEKKRTRIVCKSMENSQKYLISQDVLVKKINV